MPSRHNIRWRASDNKELAYAVRAFNAKRTKMINKNPLLEEYLPPKIEIDSLKQSIETRREYNNKIKSLKRFNAKSAELIKTNKGLILTKYEINEVRIKVRAINVRRAYERKRANVSTETGTMGAIENANLKKKSFNINTIDNWGKYVETVEKQVHQKYYDEKKDRYKANFITALNDMFGSRANKIIDMISELDAETVVDLYYKDPILQIDFVYDPLEMDERLTAIEEHLERYVS